MKMEKIIHEIKVVRNKLEEEAESIDEVMMLLDYIEIVKRPESKIDELTSSIRNLKQKMDYILELEITFEGHEFQTYLALLHWPVEFRAWIEKRKLSLLSAKENLFA